MANGMCHVSDSNGGSQVAPYNPGQSILCVGVFKSPYGANTDPTTITFKAQALMSETSIEYVYGTDAELVRDAEGRYSVALALDESGGWAYRFEGTGACAAVGESEFLVRQSPFA